jgi:hypothetical protein
MLQKRIFKFWAFLFFFVLTGVFGQTRGAILDEDAYNSLPRKAALAARSYEGLPSSFSLKQYAPLPGDQNDYGTCVAWASAYAARTISESVALNRLNQTETTQNVFSPVYIYRNIRPDDPECIQGAQIYSALDLMKDSGAVRMLDVERVMDFTRVDLSNYSDSRRYPIAGYVTLFSREDRQKPALITRSVKKSLTEGKPVIIGMNTPDSFLEARNVWVPRESPRNYYGGHAMCVVGYDDDKNGGAFEILNSWGRKWGNGGFIWVPYQVFIDFVIEGYEIIENISTFSDTVRFDGFVQLEITGARGTEQAALALSPEGVYRTVESYTQGDLFSFIIGARESAYVYAFSFSQPSGESKFFSPVLLFPQTGVSPLLNYSDSTVSLPGDGMAFALDAPGTEFLAVLYSKQALDIQSIMRRFESVEGSIAMRLSAAVGNSLHLSFPYNQDEAAFTATPDDPRAVTALIIAIDHSPIRP